MKHSTDIPVTRSVENKTDLTLKLELLSIMSLAKHHGFSVLTDKIHDSVQAYEEELVSLIDADEVIPKHASWATLKKIYFELSNLHKLTREDYYQSFGVYPENDMTLPNN